MRGLNRAAQDRDCRSVLAGVVVRTGVDGSGATRAAGRAGGTTGESDAGDASTEDAPSDKAPNDTGSSDTTGAAGTGGTDASEAGVEVGADVLPDLGGDTTGN